MKFKQLLILIVAFVMLAGLARFLQRPPTRSAASESAPKLISFDLSEAERITVTTSTQTVRLARSGGQWVIESLQNFPAHFDEIAAQLRKLSTAKAEMRGAPADAADFGISPTNADYAAIRFETADGRELGTVEIGSPRSSGPDGMNFPDSHYARSAGGPVLLVDQFLGGFPRTAEDWAERTLLHLPSGGLEYVMVRRHGEPPYGLLAGTNGVWELSDRAGGEGVKQADLEQVANALSYLDFANILGPREQEIPDPSEYVAKTTNGLTYTVRVGAIEEALAARRATFDVTAADGDTNAAAMAATENARLAHWVFTLREFAAQNLVRPRAELILATTNERAAAPPSEE